VKRTNARHQLHRTGNNHSLGKMHNTKRGLALALSAPLALVQEAAAVPIVGHIAPGLVDVLSRSHIHIPTHTSELPAFESDLSTRLVSLPTVTAVPAGPRAQPGTGGGPGGA